MSEQVSLEECTTDELWEELRSRFENCVLVYSRDGEKMGTVGQDIWWWGAYSCCLGLLEYGRLITRRIILEHWMEALEADDE